MGIVIASLMLVVSGWMIISTARILTCIRQKKPWVTGVIPATFGLVAGCILAIQEYPTGATMRVAGIPMPLEFFNFENGQWIDFSLPAYAMWLGYFANIIFWPAIFPSAFPCVCGKT